jgi:hypothetical protein
MVASAAFMVLLTAPPTTIVWQHCMRFLLSFVVSLKDFEHFNWRSLIIYNVPTGLHSSNASIRQQKPHFSLQHQVDTW